MKNWTITAAIYRAALKCAAVKDIRYYLNGVHLEHRKEGVVQVGCDGHRLIAMLDMDAVGPGAGESVILPAVKLPAAAMKLEYNGEELTALDVHGAILGRFPAKAVDGKFPAWRATLPEASKVDKAGPPPYVDPALLAGFADVSAAVSGVKKRNQIRLHYTGRQSTIAVTFGGSIPAIGVIMPMRVDEEAYAIPAWAMVQPEPQA